MFTISFMYLLRGFNFIETVYELFDNPSYMYMYVYFKSMSMWQVLHDRHPFMLKGRSAKVSNPFLEMDEIF